MNLSEQNFDFHMDLLFQLGLVPNRDLAHVSVMGHKHDFEQIPTVFIVPFIFIIKNLIFFKILKGEYEDYHGGMARTL